MTETHTSPARANKYANEVTTRDTYVMPASPCQAPQDAKLETLETPRSERLSSRIMSRRVKQVVNSNPMSSAHWVAYPQGE